MGSGYFSTPVTASTPHSTPVEWRGVTTDGRTASVYASSFFAARREIMRELGVGPDEVEVREVEESK